MIVFNLSCSQAHKFDGWFRSQDDYERQAGREMIACPLCGDTHVTKELSAPRINTGVGTAEAAAAAVQAAHDAAQGVENQEVMATSMIPGLQEHMMREFRNYVRTHTEDVGHAFAETARRMHYGEEHQRNIRGRVSREEARELSEEGIETVQLPPGVVLDEFQ